MQAYATNTNQDLFPHIIIDLGSNSIKCGYNEESCPRFVLPNVIGKLKEGYESIFEDNSKLYVGNEALANSSNLKLEYPLIKSQGKYPLFGDDYENMETILRYIFEKTLKVKQENYNVFIVDSIFTNLKERVAMAKILFEKLNIYNIHFEPQNIMTLYYTGKSSGLLIESGENFTEVLPVFEGFVVSHCLNFNKIAGREMTERFLKMHKKEFESNLVSSEYYFAQEIKEKYFEVLQDGIDNLKDSNAKIEEYSLPDGNKIHVGPERYEIPEMIFNPSIFDCDYKSVQQMCYDSITQCDIMIRKELFDNLIIGGGNTFIKGYSERLKIEIDKLIQSSNLEKIISKVFSFPERKYSAWIGASGISSFSQFKDKWISKSSYNEIGYKVLEQDYLTGEY